MKIREFISRNYQFILVGFGALFLVLMIIFMNYTSISRVKIEEPEVYAHFLQDLESIPEIESFGLDRVRYSGSYTNWRLSVHLNNDVSFYFNELKSIDKINESIQRVKDYVDVAY